MHNHELKVATQGRRFYELGAQLQNWLREIGAREGWLLLFLPHTSASLALQENADPDVQADILDFLAKLVPDDDPAYRHRNEGPDDMSAHIRSLLGSQSLQLPVQRGRLQLGSWQGVFLLEHRQRPQTRRIMISFLGKVVENE